MRKGEQSDPGKGRESAKRQTSTAKKPSVKAEKAARKPGRPTDYRPEYAALKGRGDGALFGRLGYSADALVAHIEAQFAPGMSWQNYGKWHIDHKKPVALFDQTEEAQFLECWALDNLQPLWALDNAKKGARYVGS